MENGWIDDNQVNIIIVDKLGHREKGKKSIGIGKSLILDKSNLQTGYIPKEHVEELKNRITNIEENPYISNIDELYLLYTTAGYYKTIKSVTENKGVVNISLIENLFDDINKDYCVVKDNIFYIAMDTVKTNGEKITPKEAVKRYGLRVIDDVHEKTVSNIEDLQFQLRKRKLNKI